DRRDAEVLGVVRLVDLDALPFPLDVALIDGMHAGDRLDQRGLSGTVVADQGDHLTGVDLKLDVGERLDGTESLGDPAQRQHGRSGHVNHLLRRLTRREVVQKFSGGVPTGAPRSLRGWCVRGAGGDSGQRVPYGSHRMDSRTAWD